MKRLKAILVILLTLAYLAMPALPARAAGTNLIANPSVETEATGQPENWSQSRWGNNVGSLSYETTGHDGSRSLRVELTAHTDGDAKWMHDKSTVTANTSYTYTSYYKATVATEIDLEYTDTSGNVSYAYVTSVPAASDWTPLTATFTTPTNVAQVRVLHILATAGTLQTDNFSLTETVATPPPTAENLIANASFETANGLSPAGWTSNAWGTNAANFVYEPTGRTGGRSVTTNITSYASGDAKWYAEPVAIHGGHQYTYSDYYKSNVTSRVVLEYRDAAGALSYVGLNSTPASADWAQYTVDFTPPASATHVAVYHLIDTVGSLTIDDASLVEEEHSHEDGENLVPNHSLETVNGTQPAGWTSNAWGTNSPTFTYDQTGRTGSRSVTTTLTSYTDGDAKWYFSPVDVTAGKTYVYRDYYKATVPTRIVGAFVDAGGNYTYQEFASAPAATDWTQFQTTFVVPAGAVKATVFHVIDRVGTLTIDDALLQISVPVTTNIEVPNASLEEGTTTPSNWQNASWGTNTAGFQYVTNEGRTGTKSVKATVSNYVDGDAKWFFDPITGLTPGTQYRFTTWYKGTAVPQAIMLYIMEDGSEHYVAMPRPLTVSATEWTRFTDTFTVPQGAVQTSAFLVLNQNGWLQTDDYSITDYHPNGFARPLLTLTFDDGHEDNTTTALPIMEQYGFKSTQCYATDFLEGRSQAVIDNARLFFTAGHEICSHTVSHPFLTQLNPTQLNFELQHSQQYLESLFGVPVRNFATPYGDYNANVNDVIDNYYQSHRTVDEGFNSKDNFNIYRLRVQNILDTTSAAQVQAWIEQAQADNTWLILVYHRVASNPGPFDSYTNVFAEHMAAVAASGITVKTYQGALDEIVPQL